MQTSGWVWGCLDEAVSEDDDADGGETVTATARVPYSHAEESLVERPGEEGIQQVLVDQSQAQDTSAEAKPGHRAGNTGGRAIRVKWSTHRFSHWIKSFEQQMEEK